MIHMIYLAAGNSRRFYSNKLLAEFQGKPLYRHGLELLLGILQSHENTSLTVVTQYRELLSQLKELQQSRFRAVHSPDSHLGASYTIRKGLESVREQFPEYLTERDSFLFMVADQPLLGRKTLEKLIACGEIPDFFVAVSLKSGDRVGNPVLFPASFLPELEALEGDRGGRSILKKRRVEYVEAENPMELFDVDTLEDLQLLQLSDTGTGTGKLL